MTTTTSLNLDAWLVKNVYVKANQGEVNSRFLEVTLTDKGTPVNLTGKTVTFYATKPDGNVIYNLCTLDDATHGIVSVCLTSQMSAAAGKMPCEIHITDTNSATLKFVGLELEIIKCANLDDAVESTSEFTALQVAMAEFSTAEVKIDGHLADKNNPHEVTTTQIGAVPSTRTVNSKALSSDVTLNYSDVGAVPSTRTVNSKVLSSDITLDYSDVGAVPSTRTVNSKALSSDITLNYSDVGAVPTTRTVNSKALSSDITLNYSDVGAVPTTRTVNSKALSSDITLSASDVGAVPTTRTINSKSLSSDISLSASDVGAAASSHDHSASDITSGTLPIARGGTGASSIIDVHSSLSLNQVVNYETFIVTGDGNETKTHTFDFEPDCVFVFKPSQGFMKYTSDGAINYVNFGMAIKIGSSYYNSLGVNLNGNNLTLTQYSIKSNGYLVNLNASGEKYMIVAFKPHIKELTPSHLVGDGQASKIYPSKVDPRFVLIGRKDQGQIKYDGNMVYNIINCGAAIQAGSEAVSTLGTTFDGNALTLEQYSTKSNGYYVNLNTNSGGYIYCDFDPHVIGNYETFLLSGDGNSTKTHTLSFAPKFVFICKLDQAIAKYDGNMIYNIVNGGMAAKIGSTNYGTLGVALSGNNLTLTQYTTTSNGYYVNLNSNGEQYMCIAFK